LNELAIKQYRAAIKIDPSAWRAYWGLANCYFYQRRIEESERLIENYLTKIDPQNAMLHFVRAELLFFKGDFERVRELAARLTRAAPELSYQHVLMAKLYSAEGKSEMAQEELAKGKKIGAPRGDLAYWRAQIWALQNRRDEAIDCLTQAIQLGNENYPWFASDVMLQSVRNEPRYLSLMQDLKIRWEDYQKKL
jgi:serine/threonine-protein kinase